MPEPSATRSVINGPALRVLRSRFDGPLLQPGDDGYDDARTIWNGSADRHPALIARCTGVEDVVHAVNFGREHDLLVAVRGGGHSIPGHSVCEGGLMIDLSLMKGIRVDERSRTVQQMGGMISRVPRDATPFDNRQTQFVYMVMGGWEPGEDPDPHIGWARSAWAALQPYSCPGVYVNFDSDDSQGRVQQTYGAKYKRLARLKSSYDPGNLFRLNQNILPATSFSPA